MTKRSLNEQIHPGGGVSESDGTKPRKAPSIAESRPALRSDRYVHAFAKGLSVICAFGPQSPMTIAELARSAELDRAGTRRILLTLEHLGYVRSDGKRFWLTPRILNLGYRYLSSLPFWHMAQPVMEEMVAEINETCSIGVLDGDDVMYVLRVPTRRFLSFDPSIGSRIPAYVHSMGRILLAGFSDEELDSYIDRIELQAFTPNTIASKAELRSSIAEDRHNGWSFVSEQYEPGMCGIATPIRDVEGRPVAAINVSLGAAPDARQKAVETILPKLHLAARRLSGQLR